MALILGGFDTTKLDVSNGKAINICVANSSEENFPISMVQDNHHGYLANVKGYSTLTFTGIASGSTAASSFPTGIKADGTIVPLGYAATSPRAIDVTDYDYVIIFDMYTNGYTATLTLS
jgi:hypothetical protein